jgi:hypothetical protein
MENNWATIFIQIVGVVIMAGLCIGIIQILGGWLIGGLILSGVFFLTYIGLRRF